MQSTGCRPGPPGREPRERAIRRRVQFLAGGELPAYPGGGFVSTANISQAIRYSAGKHRHAMVLIGETAVGD
jgi:hypothetical protein